MSFLGWSVRVEYQKIVPLISKDKEFYMQLYSDWLQQWPEHDVVWPDMAVEPLTNEQEHELHAAEEERKRELKSWMTWAWLNLKRAQRQMAPPSKYSPEQLAFIRSYNAKFLECKADRDYESFWNPFFEDWATKFPERGIIFPDIPLDKLGHGHYSERKESQCYSQCRNRQHGQSDHKGLQEKSSHTLKDWEMYAHLHYHDKVKDTVKSEQDALKSDPNAKPAKKMNLSIIKKQTKLAFEGESNEVKEEVWAVIEAMKEKKLEEMEEIKKNSASPDNTVYISKIGAILTRFFEELHVMTGWTFSVLMGGPDPVAGGMLDISSFHVGTTKLGNRFSQAYPQFTTNVMLPYLEFVHRAFPEATVSSTPSTSTLPEDTTSSPAPADISGVLTSESPININTALSPSTLAPSTDDGHDNAMLNTTDFFSSTHLQHFSDEALELPPLEDNVEDFNPQLPILPMPLEWQIPATGNDQSMLAAGNGQSLSLSLLELLHSPDIDLPPPEAPQSVSGVTSLHLHQFFTSPSNIYNFTPASNDGLDTGSNSSLASPTGGNSSLASPLAETASVSHNDALPYSATTSIPPQHKRGAKCAQNIISISAIESNEENSAGRGKQQHFQSK
ncbi:hypothetical protein EDB19DRAFT_1826664 [Suillus lakei]|nr:hypothetical protein EDB19DRAFT_1826664 [Suillus lakei]